MKISLLPKEKIFYDHLEKLAAKLAEGMGMFQSLIHDFKKNHPAISGLENLEHDCDKIVHDIMVRLNKSFITPIDREDIHLLAKEMDDLVDIIQTLSKRMILFEINFITETFKEMAIILEKAIFIVVDLIKKIRSLKDISDILEKCIRIHELENEADVLFEKALGKLFHTDNPIELIKWKEIYDFLERAVDKCEDISDVIWGIVVKYG